MKEVEIKLGYDVEDTVTGYKGRVITIDTNLNRATQASVQPPVDKDGKIPDPETFDLCRLKILSKKHGIDHPNPEPMYAMGQEVVDPISTMKGKIICHGIHINGCSLVAVQAKFNPKAPKFNAGVWFPEKQVKPVGKILKKEKKEELYGSTRTAQFADSKPNYR